MLRLPAPYGLNRGTHISLRTRHEDFDHRAVARAVRGAGCPDFVIPKIISCLHYSGRYDCLVMAAWFNYYEESLRDELALAGAELIVLTPYRAMPIKPPPLNDPRRRVNLHNLPRAYDTVGIVEELLRNLRSDPFREYRETIEEGYRRYVLQGLYNVPRTSSLFAVINPEIY